MACRGPIKGDHIYIYYIYIYIHSCLDRISANIRKLLPVVPASVMVAQSVERIDHVIIVVFSLATQPHTIHVWYTYLHLVDFYGKCR